MGVRFERKLILCACGCGKLRPNYDKKGRIGRFIVGHTRRGKRPANYKGGALSAGYLMINGFRQHRLVYQEYYKCCLLKWAVVHHINGIKVDNRIENLQGMTIGQHISLHHKIDMSYRKCVLCGSSKTKCDKYGYIKWLRLGDDFMCTKCYDKRRWLAISRPATSSVLPTP